MSDLQTARQAKATLEHVADEVSETVASLYESIVMPLVTTEAITEFIYQALPVVRVGASRGEALANTLHRQLRRQNGVSRSVPFRSQKTIFKPEQVESSLRFVGLVEPAKAAGVSYEVPFAPVNEGALVARVGQSAARRVVQNSMDTGKKAAMSDKAALGWLRITQGPGACSFCSMLESRGAIYSKDSFEYSDSQFESGDMPPDVLNGELVAKVHDFCRCILAPVFSRNSDMVKNADELYKVWKKVQKDYAWLARRAGFGMAHIWRLYWEGRIEAVAQRFMM